jgi:hypothetical protein
MAKLEPLIGEMPRRADGRGRPWCGSWEVVIYRARLLGEEQNLTP